MGAYDLVLGMDWLEQYNPMTCDWLNKSNEFDYLGKKVKLQGIVDKPVTSLSKISGEQTLKCSKDNELWVVVLVGPVSEHDQTLD